MAGVSLAARYVCLLVALSLFITNAQGQGSEPPMLMCPDSQSKNTGADKATTTLAYNRPTQPNGIDVATWKCDPPTQSTFNIGITTVTCSAQLTAGGGVTCTFRVTVNDNRNPVFNKCPDPQRETILDFDPLQLVPAPSVPVSWDDPAASDNSGYQQLSSTHQKGAEFPLGVTSVKYTARDRSGNSETCIFSVHVVVQPPKNHTYATDVLEEGFTVFWPQSENGAITEYYVLVWKNGTDKPSPGDRRPVKLESDDRDDTYISLPVSDLSAGELYNVEVGIDGSGEVISFFKQWTDPMPPTNVEVNPTSPSSVELSWSPSASPGNVEQYRVSVGGNLGYVTKETGKFTVENLRPGGRYIPTVWAVVGSGNMRREKSASGAPFTTVPLNASQMVTYNYTESTIAVAWASVDQPTSNEPYMLLINPPEAEENYITVFDQGNFPRAEFRGLEANKNYQIRVISNLGLSIEATHKTRPGRVRNLRPAAVTDDSITLEWDPPTEGAVTSYDVEISPPGTEKPAVDTDASRVFNGLQNGTEYYFKVVSVYEGMQSVPQTLMVTAGSTLEKSPPLNMVAMIVGAVLGVFALILAIVMFVTCIKYCKLKRNGGHRDSIKGQSNRAMLPDADKYQPSPRRQIADNDGDLYEIAGSPVADPGPMKGRNPSPEYQNTPIGPAAKKPPMPKSKPRFARR